MSIETEKAFQTGVRMTVTEALPPDPQLLKFLLERRMPGQYRETKEVVHTHSAGLLFQKVALWQQAMKRTRSTERDSWVWSSLVPAIFFIMKVASIASFRSSCLLEALRLA